jgi:hypothetical protein
VHGRGSAKGLTAREGFGAFYRARRAEAFWIWVTALGIVDLTSIGVDLLYNRNWGNAGVRECWSAGVLEF